MKARRREVEIVSDSQPTYGLCRSSWTLTLRLLGGITEIGICASCHEGAAAASQFEWQ